MDHHFVTGQGPWTLYPVEIDERPDEETRQGTLLGLMLQQEEVKMKMGNRCPCLLMGVGRASPLNGGGGTDGWVWRDLPTSLAVPWAGIVPRTLLLLPGPQKWQLGFDLFVSCS